MQCQNVFLRLFFHPFVILKLRIYMFGYCSTSVFVDELGPLEVTVTGICFHCETHI